MINFLKGKIEDKSEYGIVLCVGGMGFEILMPIRDMSLIGQIGQDVHVYTYLCVREDSLSLMGFCDKEGLEWFKRLIGVSGVGPKAALAVLSSLSPSELASAIVSGDSKTISKSRGIGGKTAQRIVLELKGNIDTEEIFLPRTSGSDFSGEAKAVNALIALGCSPSEAQKCVVAVWDGKLSVEEVIKECLRRLGNGI
ncbi:MAG: Holliday junction branch migration protein RuvA [Clostridia bacterium]|nr:Holliday junction branch migration protein RuvA [Clostridia bacterium]